MNQGVKKNIPENSFMIIDIIINTTMAIKKPFNACLNMRPSIKSTMIRGNNPPANGSTNGKWKFIG